MYKKPDTPRPYSPRQGPFFLGHVAPSQIHKTVSFFLEEHQKRWYVLFHGRERVSVGRISTMTATREQGRQDLDAALVKAAGDGEPHTVAVLIGLGADVEAVDEDGKKALMVAAMKGHTGTVNALRQHGATSQTRPETDGYGPGTSPGLLADEFGSLELSAGNAHLLADDTVPSEQLTCSICMHHMPSVRFHPCGHTACRADARQLRRRRADCHICRQPITEFQPMFL